MRMPVAQLLWAVLIAAGLSQNSGRAGVPTAAHWIGTWASSPQASDNTNAPPAPGFASNTLRQIVHVSVGGKRLRVRFSNSFGATALPIAAAHIALSAGGSAIKPQTDKALTFDGNPSVNIPAGALIVSDPLDFDVAPLGDLAITIRLTAASNPVTTHPGSRATSYLETGDAVSASDLPNAAHIDHWYFLNGVDVEAESGAAVAILGDSITDGHGSTTNDNNRWTDNLARRLHSNSATASVGVLNHGIGGNRLLHDGLGPNALARFDRDILAQTSVRWLVVLEGINDIGTGASARAHGEEPPSAQDLIDAYKQIIVRAHTHNIRVYGATILPYQGAFYFRPEGEATRQAVNNWIRTSGNFDGVIDFDAATRDPRNPSHLSPAVDSGDHLHPSVRGYEMMADAVDLKLFAQ
ncbi:MAG: SGNH/GDSL hydrolase family protein [Acidobacteriaceae bacterium]|nr:SGNH/GDSL hydrolase family protein [Acidobacteriaceae bacterium]